MRWQDLPALSLRSWCLGAWKLFLCVQRGRPALEQCEAGSCTH
jgi:hypothetical protein